MVGTGSMKYRTIVGAVTLLCFFFLLLSTISGSMNFKREKYSTENELIPVTYYGEVEGKYIGYQIPVHQVAREARESFYSGKIDRALFLVEYIISQEDEVEGSFVWKNYFEFPTYGLKKGWSGSLIQAGVIKALILAHKYTKDERYLHYARKALKAFELPVEKGGLLVRRGDCYWYPEYAKENPPFVLNEFITSLIWIHEYYKYTGDEEALEIFQKGVDCLIRYLPEYDAGNLSYYDSEGRINAKYHELHVKQMAWMYEITGKDIFLRYHEKWSHRNS